MLRNLGGFSGADDHGILMHVFNVGGSGGRGGDVILECSPRVWDFSGLQHHLVCTYIFYQISVK